MKPKKRQKLCPSCEGEVDLDVIVCPFCAADLREEKPEKQRPHYMGAPSFESLYPPPHTPKMGEPVEKSAEISAHPEEAQSKGFLFPIFLFTLGAQFLLLGLLTFLFSQHGVVILKWSAKFWFVYTFLSLPLLVFGYKMLSKK